MILWAVSMKGPYNIASPLGLFVATTDLGWKWQKFVQKNMKNMFYCSIFLLFLHHECIGENTEHPLKFAAKILEK